MRLLPRATGCLLVLLLATSPTEAQTNANQWPDEATCRELPPENEIVRGWCLAIDRDKGNCIACHTFNVTPWPKSLPVAGNIAPPLVAMEPRFPDIGQLRRQVADAPALNPRTTMPPYLRHELLTEAEIERILQFLLTL